MKNKEIREHLSNSMKLFENNFGSYSREGVYGISIYIYIERERETERYYHFRIYIYLYNQLFTHIQLCIYDIQGMTSR